jgi:hypothetical protein
MPRLGQEAKVVESELVPWIDLENLLVFGLGGVELTRGVGAQPALEVVLLGLSALGRALTAAADGNECEEHHESSSGAHQPSVVSPLLGHG